MQGCGRNMVVITLKIVYSESTFHFDSFRQKKNVDGTNWTRPNGTAGHGQLSAA